MRLTGGLDVLVLGATGIIGRQVCLAAAACGHRVAAVSRGTSGQFSADGVEMIVADARDRTGLNEALAGQRFDAVVDLLSFTPTQLEDSFYALTDIVDQYVFVSSATVSQAAPFGGVITEESPLIVSGWNYPLLKIACEAALRRHSARTNQRFTIVRPYITYSEQRLAFGPWEGDQVVARLRLGLPVVIADEIASARTSLTHSADLARGIVGLIGNSIAHDDVFQIAAPEATTWRDVYELAAGILGVDLDLRTLPAKDLVSVRPDLAGKIHDRLLTRAFSDEKLRGAVPQFEFECTLRRGYSRVLDSWPVGNDFGFGATDLGRYDRLVAKTGGGNANSRPFAAGRLRTMDSLRYLSGRYAGIDAAVRTVRAARGQRRSAGDYA